MLALAEAGADVIELGVPFSDPVADGPVIQRASERALRSGTTLAGVLRSGEVAAREDRSAARACSAISIPFCRWDLRNSRDARKAAGADGVLITDLTPEEAVDYRAAMSSRGLDTIFLAAPTSTDERLALIAKATSGFLYLISRTGVTGAKDQLAGRIAGAGAARAARHRACRSPSASAFRCRGMFRCWADWPTPPWSDRRWWKRSSAPRRVEAAAAALAARVKLLKGAAVAGMSRREPQA